MILDKADSTTLPDGRRIVDGKKLTLTEWLGNLVSDDVKIFPDFAFPTDEMRQEYLESISERSCEDVDRLLRHFLISSCTMEMDMMHFHGA